MREALAAQWVMQTAITTSIAMTVPARDLLLAMAFRHVIDEPNIESAHQRFVTLAGTTTSLRAFADAVADCLREGLIHEPVRLPEGALQCHWHLELTPRGVATVREKGKPTC